MEEKSEERHTEWLRTTLGHNTLVAYRLNDKANQEGFITLEMRCRTSISSMRQVHDQVMTIDRRNLDRAMDDHNDEGHARIVKPSCKADRS